MESDGEADWCRIINQRRFKEVMICQLGKSNDFVPLRDIVSKVVLRSLQGKRVGY